MGKRLRPVCPTHLWCCLVRGLKSASAFPNGVAVVPQHNDISEESNMSLIPDYAVNSAVELLLAILVHVVYNPTLVSPCTR